MIFSLKSHPILNYTDLRRWFSPFEIYERINTYLDFAKIHISPFLKNSSSEEGEFVKICLKHLSEVFQASDNDPQKLFDQLWDESKRRCLGKISADNEMALTDLNKKGELQKEQLDHINSQLTPKEREEDPLIALKLFMIFKSAMVDINTADFTRPPSWSHAGKDDVKTAAFPMGQKELILQPSMRPYCYKVYPSSSINDGDKIETIRLKADKDTAGGQTVKIELYYEDQCKQKRELKPNQYLYVNACRGEIIKILPTISIHEHYNINRIIHCMYRKDLDNSRMIFEGSGIRQSLTNVDIFSFAAAGDKGYVYLCVDGNGDGKIHFSQDYLKSLNLADQIKISKWNISENFVEIQLLQDGLCLLTSDGQVYAVSSILERNEERLAYLNPYDRPGAMTLPDKYNDVCEICGDRAALALRYTDGSVKYTLGGLDSPTTEEIKADIIINI